MLCRIVRIFAPTTQLVVGTLATLMMRIYLERVHMDEKWSGLSSEKEAVYGI